MGDTVSPNKNLSPVVRELDPARLDPEREFAPLLDIIEQARSRAFRAVNRELVGMYWDVGAYISAKVKAERWGRGVVTEFSHWVTSRLPDLGGFSPQNVWRMRQFYETYQGSEKLSPLVREISWTNNLLIMMSAKSDEAREFYLRLAARERLSKRELERQLDSLLFERTALSNESTKQIVARHPEVAALRDSYTLEFLGLPARHRERDLRDSIVAHLRDFILEFGKDFTFVGQEYRLQVGAQDFYVDLLMQNRELDCLVAIELKTGVFMPEYLGQLDFYLEALDRDVRKPRENPSVGLILCTGKDDTVAEYALSRSLSPAMIAEYQLRLPDKKMLETKLRELSDVAVLEVDGDAADGD
ncbi:MAG: PDDEXK nuclease domain-containing protein [Propionibacteriaceae bacterium]|nr:PDDEXK nuclease domain-containing protein [Propionibacteriaceae bacterium]